MRPTRRMGDGCACDRRLTTSQSLARAASMRPSMEEEVSSAITRSTRLAPEAWGCGSWLGAARATDEQSMTNARGSFVRMGVGTQEGRNRSAFLGPESIFCGQAGERVARVFAGLSTEKARRAVPKAVWNESRCHDGAG